ncbi:hypothetical protein H072_331 [Dactylellina haptotyla CBS 200.50]|uniref:Uncharacterized protein n=1 Tax=Dactylellina haptotyla (strain CBS 200.50) TaxID=1284197 RepID=S8AXG7_DACHA|nr:hypothetical protein H072_331 [Dactylellina haptotyla CBS 200.50]
MSSSMELDSPFSPSVIARLQDLSTASFYHSARINNYPVPTETHLDTVASAEAQHQTSVTQGITTLDELIKKQGDAIKDIRSRLEAMKSQEDATPQKIALANANGLKDGSERYFAELPWLPEEESGLNTLLAVRGVLRIIEERRKGLTDTERRLDDMRKVVRREQAWVSTAQEMEKELKRKIDELEKTDRVNEGEEQRDKRKLAEYEKTRKEMAVTSARLVKELGKFVKDRLGAMLAVEETGGPVVGSELDVRNLRQYLEVESNPTGRRNKAMKTRERGQKRLDEIWGADEEGSSLDPEKRAGEELIELIEASSSFSFILGKRKLTVSTGNAE